MNVAAFAGHTALRNNHMDRLDRAATADEIAAMRVDLSEALDGGALGLSSGLAYANANAAPAAEVAALADLLRDCNSIYATHMRTEAEGILDAMREACEIGRASGTDAAIKILKIGTATKCDVLAVVYVLAVGQHIRSGAAAEEGTLLEETYAPAGIS